MPRSRSAAAAATPAGLLDVGARRQQRVAVRERPAEVLRVGELQPLGADPLRQRHELRHARDVAAVNDHVERQRQAERARRARDLQLRVEIVAPGDPGGAVGIDVLHRQLDAVEARADQLGQPRAIGGDAAGDQVDVELLRVRGRHQRRQIRRAPAARRRSGSPAGRRAPPRRRTPAPRPPCRARRRAAPARAGSSSSHTPADSGRSAPRPACTAAAFHQPPSRHDQQAPIVERTQEAYHLGFDPLARLARRRGQLVDDRRDRAVLAAQRDDARGAVRSARGRVRDRAGTACPTRDRAAAGPWRPGGRVSPPRSSGRRRRAGRRLHAVEPGATGSRSCAPAPPRTHPAAPARSAFATTNASPSSPSRRARGTRARKYASASLPTQG